LTLLPDGTVLVTGGSSGAGKNDLSSPVLSTELWDPVTETFTVLARNKVFRGYHSSALLLPDGRVISGGGDFANFEIFSPPYLFRGERPRITATADGIAWGQQFKIYTPDAASISKVTLMKIGSSTHAFNVGQRIHDLSFTRGGGVLNVTAPASRIEAQPGHFMLFILNEAGVPSMASIVQLSADASPAPDPGNIPVVGLPKVPANGHRPLVVVGDVTPDVPENPDEKPIGPNRDEESSASCAATGGIPALLPLLLGWGWVGARRVRQISDTR
ncbi:MAG: galactose oxidase early set domain-containing protein, partial [Myxococcaceae bacterium]